MMWHSYFLPRDIYNFRQLQAVNFCKGGSPMLIPMPLGLVKVADNKVRKPENGFKFSFSRHKKLFLAC